MILIRVYYFFGQFIYLEGLALLGFVILWPSLLVSAIYIYPRVFKLRWAITVWSIKAYKVIE